MQTHPLLAAFAPSQPTTSATNSSAASSFIALLAAQNGTPIAADGSPEAAFPVLESATGGPATGTRAPLTPSSGKTAPRPQLSSIDGSTWLDAAFLLAPQPLATAAEPGGAATAPPAAGGVSTVAPAPTMPRAVPGPPAAAVAGATPAAAEAAPSLVPAQEPELTLTDGRPVASSSAQRAPTGPVAEAPPSTPSSLAQVAPPSLPVEGAHASDALGRRFGDPEAIRGPSTVDPLQRRITEAPSATSNHNAPPSPVAVAGNRATTIAPGDRGARPPQPRQTIASSGDEPKVTSKDELTASPVAPSVETARPSAEDGAERVGPTSRPSSMAIGEPGIGPASNAMALAVGEPADGLPAPTRPLDPARMNAVPIQADPSATAETVEAAPDDLVVHITAAASNRRSHLQVQLQPHELGRVEIGLEFDGDAGVQVRIRAEDGQALDLLQRHGHQLERALTESGFELGRDGIRFELDDPKQGRDEAGREAGEPMEREPDDPRSDGADNADPAPPTPLDARRVLDVHA